MNVYIDCGAFKGSILRHFLKNPAYGLSYKCYAIECNPALSKVDYGSNVTVIRKAAWIKDGSVQLFMNRKHPTIEGHSVYKEKITGNLDKEHPVELPCFDFSTWLKNTFTADDHIVMKCNIEGAEYDILEKCIATESISLIKELHIQWHVSKIPGIRPRHDALVAALAALPLKVYNGYGRIRSR